MFPLDSKIQKAFCQVYWPTNDLSDISRSRRLNILASILMDRMREKVREEIGEAYSPVSKSKPSPTFTNYGYLYASLSCKPDQAENLSEVILDIGEILAKDGITEDELVRAKKPLLSGLEVWLKNNQYWLIKVLGNCQENSERLDWTRNIESDIASINKGEIESYAKKYLQRDKGVVVLVIPDKE
jgi:zinc protease